MDEAEAPAALIPRFRTLEEADRRELCSQATHSEEQSPEKFASACCAAAPGPHLSLLGDPHPPLCCCCCRRSRSCHNCKVSGRRLSSPAGSSRLAEDRARETFVR